MAPADKKFLSGAFKRVFAQKKESYWHSDTGEYPRLLTLDCDAAGLAGKRGIYAAWHLGVRPQWLHIGAAPDLAEAFRELANSPEILAYDQNRGVFAAWAFPPEDQVPGTVLYLRQTLNPAFGSPESPDGADIKPVSCPLPPGTGG